MSYDEMVTAVTEAEAILNSRPLTYVSSEDIEEPLTPSHLLTGRRILSLPDYQENPEDVEFEVSLTTDDVNKRVRYLNVTLEHFWRRWQSEYLAELRSAHKSIKKSEGNSCIITPGDIVLVHDEKRPRSVWKIGRVKKLVSSKEGDGKSRGAVVQVTSKGGRLMTLRRPLQLLYPLEINCKTTEQKESIEGESSVELQTEPRRPRRKAAVS